MSYDYQSLVHPGIQSLSPYVPGKSIESLAAEQGLTDIIKMASNENPLGCSPLVRQALAKLSAQQIASYPAPIIHPLNAKLSLKLGIEQNRLLLSNGSDFLFTLVLTAFALHSGKKMLSHEKAFISYQIQAQTLGIPFALTPLKEDWQVDIDALINAAQHDTAVIFLANPNNPTGLFIEPGEIKRLLDNIPPTTLLVLDEAYYEYAYPLNDKTTLNFLAEYSNLILSRTFSKAYGLAGLRLGYVLAHPKIIEILQRIQLPFTINQAVLEAAFVALDDEEFISQTLAMNTAGMKQLTEGLTALGLSYLPSRCNFITFDCQRSAINLYQDLLKEGIILRPLQAYGLDSHLRLSIGTPIQNERFLAKLALCLGKNKELEYEK